MSNSAISIKPHKTGPNSDISISFLYSIRQLILYNTERHVIRIYG